MRRLVRRWIGLAKDASRMRLFEDSHEKGKPVSETLRPEDAQRFAAAFKARKAGRA